MILRLSLVLLCLSITPATAQSTAEVELVKKTLAKLQRPSIRENVEYCGYIGLDRQGNLVASRATRGDAASCLSVDPKNIRVITASYHTHAAYSPDYSGEIPSGQDVEGDEEMGIDGYVSTPGGRLWYVDTTDMVISQLCGFGCLPRDGRFEQGADGKFQQSYTYKELVYRLNQ